MTPVAQTDDTLGVFPSHVRDCKQLQPMTRPLQVKERGPIKPCAMVAPFEPAPVPTTRFGPYEIVGRIGRGGMGDVFEARHVELGTRCAIKVIHPAEASDEAAVRRMLREGRAAGAIRHPHVIAVFDVGTEHGTPYLVMELLEGEDLACRLRREAPLTVQQTTDLLLPVLSGIAAAHDKGIIHRDIKPSNVFLSQRYGSVSPVVIDFGISKSVHRMVASSTSSGFIAGTAMYMAPEQLRGTFDVAGQCDQYALGVLIYECVTGGTPFFSEDYYELLRAIMTADIVPASELNPGVPADFDRVLLRALARSPAGRFPDMRTLGAALLPFASKGARAQWSAEFGAGAFSSGGLAVSAPVEDRPASVTGPPAAKRQTRRIFGLVATALVPGPLLSGFLWMAHGGSPAGPSKAAARDPAPATCLLDAVGRATRREATLSAPAGAGPALSLVRAAGTTRPELFARAPPKRAVSSEGAPVSHDAPIERGTGNIPIVE